EEYTERWQILQELNQKHKTAVRMQADLQGTNIRVGKLPDGQVELLAGQVYTFVTNGHPLEPGEYPINDDTLHLDVKPQEPISFADGAIEGTILEVNGHHLTVEIINTGTLKERKSINVPFTELSASSLTEKDLKDLDFLLQTGVDLIAVSFIAGPEEINLVKSIIAKHNIPAGQICVIGKIERKKALDNLYPIIQAADAIMVARGDLGIELPMEEIPIIQKSIIQLAHMQEKPVITATQMLLSMTHSNRPTRAEVSDVANAIFDGSDALMLSEETMVGVHPEHALSTMVKIAQRIEHHIYGCPNYFERFLGQS
ncbi:MAG: pyruvate kinase, partial [Methanothrix sp.]